MWFTHELKDYVNHSGHNIEPICLFLSGSGDTVNLIW